MNTPIGRRDGDEREREMAWSKGLHFQYDCVAQEPLPDQFRELLNELEDVDLRRR